MVSPEEARDAVRKYAKWGLVALAVILAPVIYTLALGFVEMIWALAAATLSVGIIYAFSPAVIDWLGNMRMQAVKAVAAANPIETMQSIYNDKMNEYKQQEAAIDEVDKQYRNVESRVDAITKKYGADRAATFIKVRDKIGEALQQMEAESKRASKALVDYKSKIDEANDFWETQKAINKALDVSEKARGDVFRQIREQVAFETTNDQLNLAFARLDGAVRRRENWSVAEESGEVVEGQVVHPAALPEAMPITNISQINKKESVR